MDTTIKAVRQLEQLFRSIPQDVQAVEVEKISSSHHSVSAKQIKALKEYQNIVL
jgi:hypothetical protein